MLLSRKLLALLATGLVGAITLRSLPAGEIEKQKETAVTAGKDTLPTAPSTPAPEEKPKRGRISLPLVEKHDSKGLKIPYYDLEGNLQMVFNIGIATKLDQDNVRMQDAELESYNEEGEPEMTIAIPTSVLNLETKVISSQTKTTIKRDDFILTGDSVEFNTETKEGKLVGNVRMLIFNFKNMGFAPPPPAPPKAAPPKAEVKPK